MSSVSVIIPVFNTAAYLRRCLDSVLEGDFRDIEVICVDDCSTDASPDILDGYSARDPRVRIIRFNENRRVSAARNAAISAARGEYLYFLDSDDWLDPGYLGAMYSKAVETGQDVVVRRAERRVSQRGDGAVAVLSHRLDKIVQGFVHITARPVFSGRHLPGRRLHFRIARGNASGSVI